MSLFYAVRVGGLLTHVVALLLDTGSLTCEIAQIVKLTATNLTNLVHLNAVDVWRLKGKIRSTPMVPDILRTVKRFFSP